MSTLKSQRETLVESKQRSKSNSSINLFLEIERIVRIKPTLTWLHNINSFFGRWNVFGFLSRNRMSRFRDIRMEASCIPCCCWKHQQFTMRWWLPWRRQCSSKQEAWRKRRHHSDLHHPVTHFLVWIKTTNRYVIHRLNLLIGWESKGWCRWTDKRSCEG